MTTSQFSNEEMTQLRDHGIVLFADRVIFDAQPPMSADQIDAVRVLAGGSIPDAVIGLWRLTAGGRLDYDLDVPMHGRPEAVAWCELFYLGSDGYRDLQGWIDYERERAREDAARDGIAWNGQLFALPIGGFEYCDRIYVVIDAQAANHGHVLAWKRGLPPAWTGAMHEDGVGTVATDLHAAFRALRLDGDPLAPTSSYCTGTDFLAYLDERTDDHGLAQTLADKVIAFYRTARGD
jgi:hypothetical protein